MARDRSFLERLSSAADLQDEPLPGLPLVELMGDRRVLIENHCGVTEYGGNMIGVKVKMGHILVCGSGLELSRMTKGQLIISGCIECVKIVRGKR